MKIKEQKEYLCIIFLPHYIVYVVQLSPVCYGTGRTNAVDSLTAGIYHNNKAHRRLRLTILNTCFAVKYGRTYQFMGDTGHPIWVLKLKAAKTVQKQKIILGRIRLYAYQSI